MTSAETEQETLAQTRTLTRCGQAPRRGFLATALSLLAGRPTWAADPASTASPAAKQASRPRIVFLSPNSEGNTYWPQVFRIMGRVAQNLGFDFVPYSLGVQDRYARQVESMRILQTEPRPQAVIVSVVIGHGKGLIEAADALGIPVFILGPLFPSELPGMGGGPRKKYRNWVAQFNWAEEEKGHALGHALLAEAHRAQAFGRDGKVHVVGLGGDLIWFGSGLRQAGLVRAVSQYPGTVLDQVVPTQWTLEEGRQLTAKLLRRFPQASVVWAASDQLGAGALQALMEAGRVPGKTAFTGGLDLSELGLGLVREGRFVATAATTMLSYAQVAVLVYDYLNGIDFAEELGDKLSFPTQVALSANVAQHMRLSRCALDIDFRAFSKVHNKGLRRYDFSLEAYRAAARACP